VLRSCAVGRSFLCHAKLGTESLRMCCSTAIVKNFCFAVAWEHQLELSYTTFLLESSTALSSV
jgi:hypothetical protein